VETTVSVKYNRKKDKALYREGRTTLRKTHREWERKNYVSKRGDELWPCEKRPPIRKGVF